jgi:hypothetical protein
MAYKPIIDIDINDQQFREFYELYQQFQGDVGELPEEWKKVNEAALSVHQALSGAAGVIAESMVSASSHAKELTRHLVEASEAQKQFRETTGQGEGELKKMKKEAKELADTLFGIGKFLFKLDAMALLGTVGGLFGLDKLAARATLNQHSARGLGMTTGEYRAFHTDLGRFADEGLLDNVANAKSDMTKQVYLRNATGLPQERLDDMNPGAITAQLVLKAHDWWASTPENQHNAQFLQATGFPQVGLTLDDIRRAGMSDREEILRGINQYTSDSRTLNVNDRDTDKLYSFYRDLELAGQTLETDFTKRLAELGPNLGGLITTLEKDAEILINDIFSPENMKAMESGMDTLTNFLGSQEFREDVKSLVEGIETIAKAIVAATKLLTPDSAPGSTAGNQRGPVNDDGTPVAPGTTYWDNPDNYKDSWTNKLIHPGDYVMGKDNNLHYMFPGYSNIAPGMSHQVNNPGNLRSAPGAKSAYGFAQFDNVNDGFKAMAALLAMYPTKYAAKTLKDILGTYAPAKDHNNTALYLKNVSDWTGFKPDQVLDTEDPATVKKLISAMVRQENGIRVSPDTVGYDITQSTWDGGGKLHEESNRLLKRIANSTTKPVSISMTVNNRSGTDIAASANAGGVK